MKHTIGQLDIRITLVKFTDQKSAIATAERTSQDLLSTWAKRVNLSASEDTEDKIFTINQRAYIIRYRENLNQEELEELAVRDGNRLYYVTGARPIGRKQFWELRCEYNA